MMPPSLSRLFTVIIRERLLWMFSVLAIGLALLDPRPWAQYRRWLELPTLLSLVALIVTIEGIRVSGYVQRVAKAVVHRTHSVRALALWLVLAAALLSMVLTNDVSLFLVVPLTVALGHESPLPVQRLVIFEALAVNAGSTLSPIGNPQNLLLWHHSGLSLPAFMLQMMPTFLVMLSLLLLLTAFMFESRPLHTGVGQGSAGAQPWPALGIVSAGLLLGVVGLLQLGAAGVACALVLLVFALAFRRILLRVDWMLLATFAVMFVGLGHLAQWSFVHTLAQLPDWREPLVLYLGGIVLSQLVSNVPATIFLSHYTGNTMALAVTVNVGGFGLGIGSLANLIALRLEGKPGGLAAFHRISLPFLFACAPLVWLAQRWLA